MARSEEIIQDIQRVASQLGRGWLSRSEYKLHGRMGIFVVERAFLTWSKAVAAAGLEPVPRRTPKPGELNPGGWNRISDEELREEFLRVRTNLAKTPTTNEFHQASKFSPDVYKKRFGSWTKAVAYYSGTSTGAVSQQRESRLESGNVSRLSTVSPPSKLQGRRMFGAPLNFRELRHEPIDEQGVVYLFGMVARELGFLVEGVTTAFPDCDAKRLVSGGHYQSVRIEFEFRSRNFRDHGHDPAGCDLIVCWEHDWRECPLEVIELKEAIKKLPA